MSHASFSLSRALCALSLTAVLAVSPAAAAETRHSDLLVQETAVPEPGVVLEDSPASLRDFSGRGYFLRYASRLLDKGYSQREVDLLFSCLPTNRLAVLLRQPYVPQAAECTAQPHFRTTTLERCLRYAAANPDLTAWEVVTQVNIGLDRTAYTYVQKIREPGAVDVLVNKYNSLDSGFVPELVQLGSRYAGYTAYLQPEACNSFTRMVDDAQKDGVWLYCVSAYRSYSYQDTLYRGYVSRSGQAAADRYSARPGFSEHQTGLAVDINTASTSAHFERTAQYRWLSENCWKYGFILRYPQGKEHITGFRFEPWHYRYVGVELAQELYQSRLTYDEYLASRPAAQRNVAHSLSLNGLELPLERNVEVGDIHFVTGEDLARILGLEYTVTEEGTALFAGAELFLAVTRDQTTCWFNDGEAALTCIPFVQGGQLLLPLEDVAALLGLSVVQEGDVLFLVHPVEHPAQLQEEYTA